MKRFSLVLFLAACGPQGTGALIVDSVSPAKGSARGGQRVTFEGHGFTDETVVKFNGRPARVVDVSDKELLVRTPSGLAGTISIEVSNGADAVAMPGAYVYERLAFTFTDVADVQSDLTPIEGALLTTGDLGRDGDLDVFQAARGEGVAVLENEGGRLTHRVLPALGADGGALGFDGYSVGAADFDGDRQLDLFIGTVGKTPSVLLMGDGEGFRNASDQLPALFGDSQRVTVLDADRDGDDDLLVTASAAAVEGPFVVKLLLNDGQGRFTDASSRIAGPALGATAIAVGDFDRDGDEDLFFSMTTEPCRLFLSDGAGAYALAAPDALPVDSTPRAGQAAVGDLDEDGSLDLYVPTDTQDLVWLNDGTAHFANLTEAMLSPEVQPADSARFADLDLDGHLDVVVVERNSRLRFLRNDGVGRLYDYSASAVGNDSAAPSRDVLVLDVQRDGVPEVVVSRGGVARPALFTAAPENEEDSDGDGWSDSLDACFETATSAQAFRAPFGCRSNAECVAKLGCQLKVWGDRAYLACTQTATWEAAKTTCAARGGVLVTPNSARENAALAAGLGGASWMAYNDVATEGTFAFEGLGPVWTNWGLLEPNNGNGGEDCSTLGVDGLWNDVGCEVAHRVMCETARLPAATPTCPVVDGGTP